MPANALVRPPLDANRQHTAQDVLPGWGLT